MHENGKPFLNQVVCIPSIKIIQLSYNFCSYLAVALFHAKWADTVTIYLKRSFSLERDLTSGMFFLF